MGWGDFWGHGTTSVAKFSSRLRRTPVGACEYHLLEHYLRGKFSPRLRRMRVSPSGALPQGQFFPRAFGACEYHHHECCPKRSQYSCWWSFTYSRSRQRCREEFLPTGLLRPGGDYHLVIAGKGEHHPVNPISQALDQIITK